MKSLFLVALATSVLVTSPVCAQQPGVTRTDLQRRDLSVPGREVIQVRVDLAPGAVAPRHSHPGEEIIFVLAGGLEYQVGNDPPVKLRSGEVLFIPAGVVHSARNLGDEPATELATYIVEKGRPLIASAP